MKTRYTALALAVAVMTGQSALAGEAEAKKWIDSEFQPSTLSKDQQMAEMKWFIDAAKKLQAKGVKEISVVSETRKATWSRSCRPPCSRASRSTTAGSRTLT